MAQSGSAHGWGPWGRKFKSCHPDHIKYTSTEVYFICSLQKNTEISIKVLTFLTISDIYTYKTFVQLHHDRLVLANLPATQFGQREEYAVSNRHDYTDNTIVIRDLLGADAIHVHFRKRLSEQQLAALKEVNGVCSVRMIENAYGTSVGVRSGQLHYGAGLNCARAFSFEELAPQIALVVSDALGISLDMLDLRVEAGGTRKEQDASAIMAATRKLRKQPTPRNPHCEFAATADDLVPGTKLLQVKWDILPHVEDDNLKRASFIQAVTVAGHPVKAQGCIGGNMVNMTYKANFLSGFRHMAELGIEPYEHGQWNACMLTIVNTAENRRKLVKWLLERGNPTAEGSAAKIMQQYPRDFTAKVVIENGKLTAKIG